MALPPGFLDELRARTPLTALVGRRVKLSKSGRNWKGCCPFHGEKSPSFHVYDDHFHCFGCGAHGDAITFVMQSEGASFPDAVERLAGEAGLEVPKPSPRAAEAERQRLDLHGVLDLAQSFFARRLREPDGAAALDYLRRRGVTDALVSAFGLGWSGDGRGALSAELARAGVTAGRTGEAGLLRETEDGSARELFWNRVTFPICDRRGRLISFGGRTLGDAKPKYINGPETPVFSKKRSLYALDLARAGLRAGEQRLVVTEGYMDVIALHGAGFAGAVAPLGTALTAEQLEELWRLSPEPVLCFDGDAAGARAAARAAELCLPLLTPERSLRLATLPGGEDPDTLVRTRGASAFAAVLDAARPLSAALYDMVREQGGDSTPEGRAALRARLVAAAARIGDRALAAEYRSALLERFYAARKRGAAPSRPSRPPRTPATLDAVQAERGRCLVAILLRHPDLLRDTEEAFAAVALSPAMAGLRDAIMHASERDALDSATLLSQLNASGAEKEVAQALSSVPYPLPACAHADAMPAEAERGWWHIFGLMHRSRLEDEVLAAKQAFNERPDEAAQRRLLALCAALGALASPDGGADAEP